MIVIGLIIVLFIGMLLWTLRNEKKERDDREELYRLGSYNRAVPDYPLPGIQPREPWPNAGPAPRPASYLTEAASGAVPYGPSPRSNAFEDNSSAMLLGMMVDGSEGALLGATLGTTGVVLAEMEASSRNEERQRDIIEEHCETREEIREEIQAERREDYCQETSDSTAYTSESF
jgi:hypothetical protein